MASTTVTGVIASSAKSGTLTAGDVISFALETSGPVTIVGTPRLTLSNGAFAAYGGVDGSGRAVFSYPVAAGDSNTGALSVTGLDTQSGSINGPTPQTSLAVATSVGVGSGPTFVTVADVSGDGRPDLLTSNSDSNSVSVRLGNGSGGFSGSTDVAVGSNPTSVGVGDFNNDGRLDLVAPNFGTNTVSLRLGVGGGVFAGSTNFTVGSNPSFVAVADVNGDSKLDLLAASFGSDSISVHLGNGNGTFSAPTSVALPPGSGPSFLALADVNGDGKLDLLAANLTGNSVSVRLGNGTGGFTGATNVAVGSDPTSVAVADVNGDGKLDFLTANSGSANVSVRLGNGTGGFTGSTDLGVGIEPRSVALADVNGDGRPDLLTADASSGAVAVRLGDGAGGFSGVAAGFSVGGAASSVVAADVNGDGKLDLPAANSTGTTVSVALNTSTFPAPFDASSIASAAGAATGRAVDTTAPAAPVVALASDTGTSAGDGVTRSGVLTLSGIEADAALSYVVDGQSVGATFDPAALGQSAHTVTVTQTDPAGNVSAAGSLSFTLDTLGPTVAGVTASGPRISNGTGTLTTGERALFAVSFSEALEQASAAAPVTLTLSNGATAVFDAGASDATRLVFAYTVKLEDKAADLAVSSVNLNGATLVDIAGNAADLVGAVINPAGTLTLDGFTGTSGSDRFKGTSGAETFRGLGGNDTYAVNNKGDRIVEAKGAGRDSVVSSISYTLGSNVENLSLSGSGNTSATGNGLANALSGNKAKNTLKGLDGNDTLKGGASNDRLHGGAGADKLYGGDGKKGMGSDTFVFTKLSDSTADKKGQDTIFDFTHDDLIDLKAIDASSKTKGNQAFSWIGDDKFHGKAGELRYDKAKSDTFISADTNGDKKADFSIHLDDAVKLVKADFLL